jgi:hypothetical protein
MTLDGLWRSRPGRLVALAGSLTALLLAAGAVAAQAATVGQTDPAADAHWPMLDRAVAELHAAGIRL